MSKIRFVADQETIYDCTVSSIGPNQIRLVFPEDSELPDISTILSGFVLLNEHNLEVMDSYEDYIYEYREYTGGNTFELDNDNVPWVEPEPPYVPPTPPTPPTPPEPYIPTVKETLDTKMSEFSMGCHDAIENGVDVDIDGVIEHFSYSLSGGDQNNIDDIFNTMLNTGLPQYYHCDGGSCKLYQRMQVFAIYATQKGNKMDHTTYFNQVRLQLEEEYKDMYDERDEEINAVINAYVYKEVPLEGDYLANYTQIMRDMAATIEVYRKKIEEMDAAEAAE
jgi:hypothetical protein